MLSDSLNKMLNIYTIRIYDLILNKLETVLMKNKVVVLFFKTGLNTFTLFKITEALQFSIIQCLLDQCSDDSVTTHRYSVSV